MRWKQSFVFMSSACALALPALSQQVVPRQTMPIRATYVLSLAFSPSRIAPGQDTKLQIVLTTPAPAGGFTVTLINSNPKVVSLPSKLTVPAGVRRLSLRVVPRQVKDEILIAVTGVHTTPNAKTANLKKTALLTIRPQTKE